jgi:cell wall-associated NlpC family hydrolase
MGTSSGASRKDIIDHARSLLGVPFKHQGRSARGMDCVGVLIDLSKYLQLGYQDMKQRYNTNPQTYVIRDELEKYLDPVPIKEMQPGDIVIMRILGNEPHVGILAEYEGERTLIHSYQTVGKIVEHRLDAKWLRRIVGAYSIPGVQPWHH